jgi:tetratricopeptide (TPR) repeat protein
MPKKPGKPTSQKSSIVKETQKYLAKGQIDNAIKEWQKLIKESPGANTYNALGDLYLKKGDKKNAVDSFHKAADFFKNDGFYLKALGLYKKILNIDSYDPGALYGLGEINEERGLMTDAVKYYLAAADSFSKSHKKEMLLEVYGRIIAISPSNVQLRSKVAELYDKQGLRSEAAKEYLSIAGTYEEKGDIEGSMEFYQKALALEPSNKDTVLGISYLYEKAGNQERALEHIKEALTLFPEDVDFYLRYAEIEIRNGRFDEAKEFLQRVTEKEPDNKKAMELLGELSLQEGDKKKAWAEYLPTIEQMIRDMRYDDAAKIIDSFRDLDPLETGKRLISLYKDLGDNLRVANELVSLGDEYSARSMHQEALNHYKEALSMNPDDESLKAKVIALEKEFGEEMVEIVREEKAVADALVEADIYLKYGLFEEARNLLEECSKDEPENIDIHVRLKSLYINTGSKEQAVAECLKLRDLYEKTGDEEKKEQITQEAIAIYPGDPRLAEIARPLPEEEISVAAQEGVTIEDYGEEIVKPLPEEEVSVAPQEGLTIEDYGEEIAEADFYFRQGLTDEAREILERLQTLFPESEEIRQKLVSLGAFAEGGKRIEEELVRTESVAPETQETYEPALNSDVLAIFNEFKKGLEKEVEREDYVTHYNLGLAYKELGVLDDAIKEFKISRNDPKNFFPSSSMLALCYMEKGLYPLAIEVLNSTLEKIKERDESYWAMKYDLAEAYEKKGDLEEAYDLYTEVYGWNARFRDVSARLDQVKALITKIDNKKG